MSGQGYHLAISEAQAKALLNTRGDFAVLDVVDELLEESSEVHGGYKDWDVLLLCLTGGTYDPQGGTHPLNQCFFGGRLRAGGISFHGVSHPLLKRILVTAAGARAYDTGFRCTLVRQPSPRETRTA